MKERGRRRGAATVTPLSVPLSLHLTVVCCVCLLLLLCGTFFYVACFQLIEPKFIHDAGHVAHLEDLVVEKGLRAKGALLSRLQYLHVPPMEHNSLHYDCVCVLVLIPLLYFLRFTPTGLGSWIVNKLMGVAKGRGCYKVHTGAHGRVRTRRLTPVPLEELERILFTHVFS